MMNLLALGLLVSSLVAAGVWSPPPEPPKPRHPDSLVREGHRLIVVEYELQVPRDHSPTSPSETNRHFIEEAKEKFHEAASHLPNVGQGLSTPTIQSQLQSQSPSTKDKICDAYGVCKDKLSTLVGKGKDKITEKASKVEESAKDTAKDVMDKASQLKEAAKDGIKKSIADEASKHEETAHDAVKETVDSSKDAGRDIASNISSLTEKAVNETAEAASELRRNLTDIIQRARDVAYDAVMYAGAPETVSTAAVVAQLLGFATAYGACVWVTFVSSHVLATALPRQQFGLVQSKLYPVYFRVVAYGIGVAWLAHFFGQDRRTVPGRLQGYNLLACFVLVLANMLFLEPRATKAMLERMKVEKEEGRGRDMADVLERPVSTKTATTTTAATTPTSTAFGVARSTTVAVDQEAVKGRMVKLNQRLKMLNSYSSLLNVLTLMGLTWHLVHLARRMQSSR